MKILAPLRGVTVRAFRDAFAPAIAGAGFAEAFTPFIAALPGSDPLADRELRGCSPVDAGGMRLTPQFIGKDPVALRRCLERVRAAGFATADLNCGCPYPMVRNKGRGSGLLRARDTLRRMLDAGCEVMGEGAFSVKTRLGVERPDELADLLELFDSYPLRFVVVHARTARQMYDGECDWREFARLRAMSKTALVPNGDLPVDAGGDGETVMVGRAFVRSLAEHPAIAEMLDRYLALALSETAGERPAAGRLKELLAYWREIPSWRGRWQIAKLAANASELRRLWRDMM